MYIVKYSTGSYSDYREIDIFVTLKKSKATKYVTKFNKILKKYKDHYKQYEEPMVESMNWIKDIHIQYYERWSMLNETNNCFWIEIEER